MSPGVQAKKNRLELLAHAEQTLSSPAHVRISVAAAIARGLRPGSFYRDATCGCVNLLLNYPEGC